MFILMLKGVEFMNTSGNLENTLNKTAPNNLQYFNNDSCIYYTWRLNKKIYYSVIKRG
jgi:hypothetical protein